MNACLESIKRNDFRFPITFRSEIQLKGKAILRGVNNTPIPQRFIFRPVSAARPSSHDVRTPLFPKNKVLMV